MTDQECSAWRAGPTLCANGFPQSAACAGYSCHGCGRPPKAAPACLLDEVPAHLVDDAGRMKFAVLEPVGAERKAP